MIGCRPQQPFYFAEDGDMSHYVGVATEIEYPDVESDRLQEVDQAKPPLTLQNPDPTQVWELSLEDAVRYTLINSKVLRNLGGVVFGAGGAQGEPSSLTSQPEYASTIYNPALQESDPRSGAEGALAAFDTQLTTSMLWEKSITPQNVSNAVSLFRPSPLLQDTASFQAQLQKTAATGGTFTLSHSVQYALNNISYGTPNSAQRWSTAYNVNVTAEVRQPLLQGGGVNFNRIAGPGAIPGYYNGVMIARIRTDIALADFEANVRNLVRDVERNYWELYYAYRRLDAVLAGRDSALQTWRQVHAKFVIGSRGGGAQDEAQARQQYFLFRSSVEQSLSNLYRTENSLRYLMGLTATDGRLVRPSDEPTTAKVAFDWYESHAETLVRSVELRQQKWRVKQRELELVASKNFVLPRLDAVARYSWQGMGDRLFGREGELSVIPNSTPADPGVPFSAYESLLSSDYPDWQLGLEFRMPIGFRRELAGVRNAQLNLARERAILQEQELEVSHQLAASFRDLSDNYVISQTNFNRRLAAKNEVDAVRSAYETGAATLDLLLDAQRRLAEAENDYYRSLIEYNEAITSVHYRKGSLLEYNGVCLAEGPWPGKAYFDAQRRARARDAGLYLDYGFTKPRVISRGPVEQAPSALGAPFGDAPVPDAVLTPDPAPETAPTEVIPAPQPEPTAPGTSTPSILPQPDKNSNRPSAGGQRLHGVSVAKSKAGAATTAKKYDLSNLNLDVLGSQPQAAQPAAKAAASPVRAASYEQQAAPASSSSQPTTGNWKRTAAGSSSQQAGSPSSAQADQSTSGWKKVQR
jgi:outer membrane protein TolC